MLKSVPKKVPQGARLSAGGGVMRKGLHFVELRTLGCGRSFLICLVGLSVAKAKSDADQYVVSD